MIDPAIALDPNAQTPSIRAVLGDLLTWSADRPAWQRDALRRLVVHGELTAADIDELYQICGGSAEAVPLDAIHIAPAAATANAMRLLSIADVVGVNALATEQRLEFAPEGLTVVYGDNGSGKTPGPAKRSITGTVLAMVE